MLRKVLFPQLVLRNRTSTPMTLWLKSTAVSGLAGGKGEDVRLKVVIIVIVITFMLMIHNSSSLSIHLLSTQTSLTFKMLYNTFLPG